MNTPYENYRQYRPFDTTLESKTTDYGKTHSNEQGEMYSVFLPATSRNFIQYGDRKTLERFSYDQKQQLKPGYTPGCRVPAKFHPNGDEITFYQKDSGGFYYPYGLYSAGHAQLDLQRSMTLEELIHCRDPEVTIVGDSGGYQIATGVIAVKDWNDPKTVDELRMQILRWLEATADYSMILDVPTAIIQKTPEAGFKTAKECFDQTITNMRFFHQHRVPGATKFMNILQGRSEKESKEWFDSLMAEHKKQDILFEGWAMAGSNAVDLELGLRRLIELRDQKLINEDSHWIHYLGVSRLQAACALTTAQRYLREQVSPKITISYDASSPFISVANGMAYTGNVIDKKSDRFTFTMNKMVDNKDVRGSELGKMKLGDWLRMTYPEFKQTTFISENVLVEELCYKDRSFNSNSSWDTASYLMIMNHSTEMQIQAIQEANRYYDLPYEQAHNHIPDILLKFKHEIAPAIFESEHPMTALKKYRKDLNSINGVGHRSGQTYADSQTQVFFQDIPDSVLDSGNDSVVSSEKTETAPNLSLFEF